MPTTIPIPTSVTETKIIPSDPTALGVFGLSMVTFVAASHKMGWTTGSYFGRTLLPLGTPFGFIRKGAANRPAKVVHVIEPVAAVVHR